ncbi:AP-2 complex subunit beta [Myotis davidii]|uniref:AP-2 complex subunit beta n=1 Tax=Myotis davidii TaxID=225400 RepID=L5LSQ1_MYODS|nr:AP-2 complex subunit beta [Myotis davidii]
MALLFIRAPGGEGRGTYHARTFATPLSWAEERRPRGRLQALRGGVRWAESWRSRGELLGLGDSRESPPPPVVLAGHLQVPPMVLGVIGANTITDPKYFTTNKKGEIFELKAELNNEKEEKRKEAVKKVIAAMTVGKDVSSLFPDVVNCMQTDNLELKKLVYLYLMNYDKSQPDMAIMAVNSFVKDCEDSNPLIRALAVRTTGCIRVGKIT